MNVVVVGYAETMTSKHDWRAAASRAAFQAELDDLQLPREWELPQRTGEAMIIGSGGLETHNGASVVRGSTGPQSRELIWKPFAFAVHAATIEVTLRSLAPFWWYPKDVAPRSLGSLDLGESLMYRANRRVGSSAGQHYIDAVWQLWRPDDQGTADWEWPRPNRTIDTRRALA